MTTLHPDSNASNSIARVFNSLIQGLDANPRNFRTLTCHADSILIKVTLIGHCVSWHERR